jgi:cell division protein ZapA
MAQVSISFNKRTYRFDCADGEAERLEKIAAYLKDKLDMLIREHGAVGDERLMLMAALMLTDELFEARADIEELLDDETAKLKALADTAKAERPVLGPQRKLGA